MSWRESPQLRQALRAAVFARAGGHCEVRDPGCKHTEGCGGCAEDVDHVVPRAHGGALYDPDNLRAACRRCNRGRGARLTNRERARALAQVRGEPRDPCAAHRTTPASLGVDERCPRCGAIGPSREW